MKKVIMMITNYLLKLKITAIEVQNTEQKLEHTPQNNNLKAELNYYRKQKATGILLVILLFLSVPLCDMDCTQFIFLPVGIYLIFTKEKLDLFISFEKNIEIIKSNINTLRVKCNYWLLHHMHNNHSDFWKRFTFMRKRKEKHHEH